MPLTLRGLYRIRYSLPTPGFSGSGIHFASATGKPLGIRWIHAQGFIEWANNTLDSGFVSSLQRIFHVCYLRGRWLYGGCRRSAIYMYIYIYIHLYVYLYIVYSIYIDTVVYSIYLGITLTPINRVDLG